MAIKISARYLSAIFTLLLLASLTGGPASAKYSKYPKPGTVADIDNPRPDEPEFSYTPYAPTFEKRFMQALEYTAERDTGGIFGGISRALLGMEGGISDAAVEYVEKRLSEREDCADFTAVRTALALSVNEEYPFLSDDHYERLKNALLGFKFWIDEPGENRMIFWTENHQIVFHTSEYLAGQLFPDETFSNNGETGDWHREHARRLILQWMERRARWGFSEWDSNVYYDEDMVGVLSLAGFAREKDVAGAATIVADIMLFDIACDLFHGVYGTSHGRTYANDVLSGRDDAVGSLINILTGLGSFTGVGNMSAMGLAAAAHEGYRPPGPVIRVGQEDPEEFLGFERHGIPLDKIADYGISRKKLDDAPTLWGMGAHTQPRVVDLFLRAADRYHLWDHPFLEEAGPAAQNLPRDGSVGRLRLHWEVESDRTLLGEVNKVTYRTPDYMLSTAQSYRPGERGNQHHVWQATLSPDAVVFTTNPGSLKTHDKRTPCYWGGQNRFPRAAQYKNLSFIIYNINMRKALGERNVFDFTHAFFPRWAFHEVIEKNNWIFGRAGGGYVALHSSLAYEWKDPGAGFTHDAIARGKKNIWICLMGRNAVDGDFEDFVREVLDAELETDTEELTVSFEAPGIGTAEFSWSGPLTVDGREIPLSGYKRVENPYCTSEFDSGVYEIEHGGERVVLDFPNLTIRITDTETE